MTALDAPRPPARAQPGHRESELRAIFENAPLGITLTDSRGPVLMDVNPAFAEMVGYSRTELRGSTYSALAPADELAETNAAILAWLSRVARDSAQRRR